MQSGASAPPIRPRAGALPVLAAMSTASLLLAACPATPLIEAHDGTDDAGEAGDTSGGVSGQSDETTVEPLATSTDGDDDDETTGEGSSSSSATTAIHSSSCGDGVVDHDELCDDGDLDDADECVDCRPASCGDGHVYTGHEGCDDGNRVDDDACSNTCVSAVCGDGVVQQGEECDDGDPIPDDECTPSCTLPACGDGIRQTSEFCDDAGESSDCDVDCTPAACGDSVVNHAAGEDCDDGVASALCDEDCSVAECGDGTLNAAADEACDDGNLSDADNCSAGCDKLKRVVFVSSTLYTGNMGGLAGADAKCQALATSAGLPGSFYAWLSAGVTSPETRFLRSTVPYVLPDGTQVAKHWTDLTDGILQHPIDLTEKSTPASIPADGCGGGKPTVWTNTRESSVVWNPDGCSGWTKTTGAGRLGHAKATNFTWTRFCEGMANSCGWHAAIYCVEQ